MYWIIFVIMDGIISAIISTASIIGLGFPLGWGEFIITFILFFILLSVPFWFIDTKTVSETETLTDDHHPYSGELYSNYDLKCDNANARIAGRYCGTPAFHKK
jgi:hypothetical protein